MKKILLLLAILIAVILLFNFLAGEKNTVIETNTLTQEYSSPEYSFAFKYASGTIIEENAVEGGQAILVQGKQPFQILITLFDEEEVEITEARLKKDIPNLTIENSKPIVVGGTAKGLEFFSKESANKTYEVWFASNGYFYQISAPVDSADFVKSTLATWKFLEKI